MNQPTAALKDCLTDYITGYARNNPTGLAHLATYPEWQSAAAYEQKCRTTRFMANLPDDELAAVANGSIDINQIAKALQAKA